MPKPSYANTLPKIRANQGMATRLCHHGGTARRRTSLLRIVGTLFVLFFCCYLSTVHGDLQDDAKGLTAFKQAVDQLNILDWNTSDVCSWAGIECGIPISQTTQRVTKIRLPLKVLSGSIPSGSIGLLTELRVLNLRSNSLSGNLPADLSNCGFLRSIYLQNNRLSGPLPSSFTLWPNLVHSDFSYNNFNGSMPASLADLKQLQSLYLQNNSLTGSIPALNMSSLINFNVSYNLFTGSIPLTAKYRDFNQSSFLGNSLCGFPLPACPPVSAPAPASGPSETPPEETPHKKKLSGGAIAGIVIAGVVLLMLLILLVFLASRRTKSRGGDKNANPYETRSAGGNTIIEGGMVPKGEIATAGAAAAASSEADHKRLVFFEGNKYSFDLDDLLRASAEVLGKGSVGTSYKAVLESVTIVAVKRLKDVTIEKRDFEQKMNHFGKMKHENLVPLIAYYYSREEKLLVSNYMTNGSLSALLHGNKEAIRTPLDWDTRMKIAVGAALGVNFLHDEDFTHGNIKSSNVLLTSNYTGCVSDYGLTQLVSASPAANRMVGYRAPEMTDIRKATQKTDVYSFGVLLLELLTGKPPSQASMNDEGLDLPRWVQSVPRDEEGWFSKVFDPQLTRFEGIEDEMVRVLDIAIECVQPSPDQRPTMRELVEKLENYKQHDGDYQL
eukprot:c22300_g1_i1 orf=203-2206(-)